MQFVGMIHILHMQLKECSQCYIAACRWLSIFSVSLYIQCMPGWKGTRVYVVIHMIAAVFTHILLRKYLRNPHRHRALTAIRCVNECS